MAGFFRKVNIRSTLISGLIAGAVFSIPVFFYIKYPVYRFAWLLYLGSFMFFAVIWVHTLRESRKRAHNESTIALIFASHMATIAGIAVATVLSFIMLSTMIPGYLTSAVPDKTLTGEPSNSVMDKTDGLSLQVFLAAIFINFCVGSFSGIILPFAAKRNQKKDQRDPAPLHQHGAS
ncbi:MAG: hypothetical protein EOO01_43265 [Chitinophagaceae bacterium]|nr:MAG: hypothetical protein EOO01_43265 [Chitinophagaceae bacterium]